MKNQYLFRRKSLYVSKSNLASRNPSLTAEVTHSIFRPTTDWCNSLLKKAFVRNMA